MYWGGVGWGVGVWVCGAFLGCYTEPPIEALWKVGIAPSKVMLMWCFHFPQGDKGGESPEEDKGKFKPSQLPAATERVLHYAPSMMLDLIP